MKPSIAFLFSVFAIALPLGVVGCGAEEAEAEEAAYPPIGYTPPAQPDGANSPSADSRFAALPPRGGQASSSGGPLDVPVGIDDDAAGRGDVDGPSYADTDPAALSDFRSTLDPYGAWTDDATYGTVWVPSSSVVGEDFTPYVSAGHWAYDDDYTWVSDYDWGWAPFHYGRWVYGTGPGWEWIPGRRYAGAWVSWRYGVNDWGYVGWAPLAPTWGWRGGVAVGLGFVPRMPYAFVGTGELFHPAVGTRVIAGPQVGAIAAHTQPYVAGSVGGRVGAHPSVGGPPPSSLHIAPESVAKASVDNRGLAQARAFSRPNTAVALGARAPQSSRAYASAGASDVRRAGPAYGPYAAASHFGGRLGGGFAGNASSAPPTRSWSSVPTRSSSAGYGSYGGAAHPYFGSPSASASSFRSAPSSGGRSGGPSSFGASRPAPSFSGGTHAYSGGAFHGGGSGFHGGGGGSHGGGHGGGHR